LGIKGVYDVTEVKEVKGTKIVKAVREAKPYAFIRYILGNPTLGFNHYIGTIPLLTLIALSPSTPLTHRITT